MIALPTAHWPHGSVTSLKFALAVASRLLLATAPLNAAEQLDDVQPHTPLEVARQIEALTAGGLFDPARTIPFDAHDASSSVDDVRDGDRHDASFLSDHDSQR
jgi:hypothetical protein